MIHVIATLELVPGKREAYLEEMRKNLSAVRAEAGCMAYGPAIDAETDLPNQHRIGENSITVVEQWESVDALKAHGVAPHMKAHRAATKDFVRGMELRVLSPA